MRFSNDDFDNALLVIRKGSAVFSAVENCTKKITFHMFFHNFHPYYPHFDLIVDFIDNSKPDVYWDIICYPCTLEELKILNIPLTKWD